jgi:hypothetical protein
MPQTVFYAHRNLAGWHGTAEAKELADKDGIHQVVLFTLNSDGTSVLSIKRLNAG